MVDLQKLQETKNRILSTIEKNGPSYPAKIAREVSISPLFIGAFLSEMVAERKLILSSMKVGSSPLYYVTGQEEQLEKFFSFLNHKEQEAVLALKRAQTLHDDSLDPAIRVAMRKLKDFALPTEHDMQGEKKIIWRYFLAKDIPLPEKRHAEKPIPVSPVAEPAEAQAVQPAPVNMEAPHASTHAKPKKPKQKKESNFAIKVKDKLEKDKISILDEFAVKPKEYLAKIAMETRFGRQEFYMSAKDKKKITEDDLAIALHKASAERMPAILLATGDLDKDAKAYLAAWQNMLRFEKI